MKIRLLSFVFLSFFAAVSAFGDCNVIPLPQKYEERKDQAVPVAKLKSGTPKITKTKKIKDVPEHALREAYVLTVSPSGAAITATDEAGIVNAKKTLAQIVWAAEVEKQTSVPACRIKDWPAYPYRSFMLDCGRSYFPIEDLKKMIDFMAARKINMFHWHLTDNQGWRLECKAFPQLNKKEAYERHPGKFYKYSEIREFVDWCHKRGVIVLPEIDMPGHSRAFRKAMGFDMQTSEGVAALKKILTEAFENGFPDVKKTPFFHIGTDEVKISNDRFVKEMIEHVRKSGRKVAIWNPGADCKPGEVDLVTMWSYRGRPLAGTPSLDSRLHYINHYDNFADPVGVYFSNFANVPEFDGSVGGGLMAIWADRNIENLQAVLANNCFHTSILAYAESVWCGGRDEYFKGTGTNLPLEGKNLKKFKDFERRELIVKHAMGKAFPWVPQAGELWQITEPFPNGGDLTKSFPPEKDLKNPKSEYKFENKTYTTSLARGAAVYLRHVWGEGTVRGFFEHPQKNSTVYAQTYIYSPKSQKIGLYVQTHFYSASEPDLAPPAGKWDYNESKIWINGQELQPPVWKNSHKNKSQEILLQNENFTVRDPLPAKLNAGWNAVVIKLPVAGFSVPQVRLFRWMFTFAPVSPDGKEPVKDLVFSPDKKLSEKKK